MTLQPAKQCLVCNMLYLELHLTLLQNTTRPLFFGVMGFEPQAGAAHDGYHDTVII